MPYLKQENLKDHYDYIIIGGGSAGLTVAVGLSKLKKDVLVVSKNLGGECTNYGCVPSKSFIHLADQYINSTDENFKNDLKTNVFKKIQAKIDQIKDHEEDGVIKANKMPFILAEAKFNSPKSILVNNKEITFKKAYVATGSSPRLVEYENLPKEKILTNENVFELDRIPETLTIIGGGPIGAELAFCFAKFGTKVCLVTHGTLMSRDDAQIVEPVRNNLLDLGVELLEHADIKGFDEEGKMIVSLPMNDHHKGHEHVDHSHSAAQDAATTNTEMPEDEHNHDDGFTSQKEIIKHLPATDFYLMSIGRVPNINSLNLQSAKIKFQPRGIETDNNFVTSNRKVFALGDVILAPNFTHLANNQGKFVVKKTLLPFVRKKKTPLPAVTYTSPPVSQVGQITEDIFVKKFIVDFSKSDRGIIDEVSNLKGAVFVNMLNGRIVGANLVGDFGEHAINFFTLAIKKGMKVFELENFMSPYPTYFDGISQLYSAFLVKFLAEAKQNYLKLLKKNFTRITAAFFWIAIGIGMYMYLMKIGFDGALLVQQLFDLFNSPAGIFLYILVYTVRAFISFSAVALTVLGGTIYGFWGGMLLVLIASNASASFAYLLGKTVFASESKEKSKFKIINYARENPFEAVLIGRLTFIPYDLLSYISGALKISFPSYLLATVIGSIPGTLAFVSFGASLQSLEDINNFMLDPIYVVMGFVLMGISIGISKLVKKYSKKTQA